MKKNYESELQKNKDKVQCSLQEKWHTLVFPLPSFIVSQSPLSGLSSPLFLPLQVSSLQEKLHTASLVCQSSSEQNLQLQLSLQQQQTMLTESTAHISELEESQSQLQIQVEKHF